MSILPVFIGVTWKMSFASDFSFRVVWKKILQNVESEKERTDIRRPCSLNFGQPKIMDFLVLQERTVRERLRGRNSPGCIGRCDRRASNINSSQFLSTGPFPTEQPVKRWHGTRAYGRGRVRKSFGREEISLKTRITVHFVAEEKGGKISSNMGRRQSISSP